MKINHPGEGKQFSNFEASTLQEQTQRIWRKVEKMPRHIIEGIPVATKQASLKTVQVRCRDKQPCARTQKIDHTANHFLGLWEVLQHVPEADRVKSLGRQLWRENVQGQQPDFRYPGTDYVDDLGCRFEAGPFPAVTVQGPQKLAVCAAYIQDPTPDKNCSTSRTFSVSLRQERVRSSSPEQYSSTVRWTSPQYSEG